LRMSSGKDSSSNVLWRTDEDDFKLLRSRRMEDIFDEQFRDFASWMRRTYTSRYPYSEMRRMNRNAVLDFAFTISISISLYCVLRIFYFDYVLYWAFPFFLWSLLYVTGKEDICHTRTHWIVNMTGSSFLDNMVDWSMIVVTGGSREIARRRHVSAHYSDVSNHARLFSDVWIPFITLPLAFYVFPHKILQVALDKEYCKKEMLERKQLFIEAIGLYCYMAAAFYELYRGSFFIVAFHTIPTLIVHGATACSAAVAHSGIDKRNSFNSNGLFEVDKLNGLFWVHIKLLCLLADNAPLNHGIHHAFSQLPLHIVNKDHREINRHCLEHYKDVRFNQVLTHIMHKNILDRLPPPKWYHYIVQFFVSLGVIILNGGIFLGLPVTPVPFELMLVDYRALLVSTKAERYANHMGLLKALEFEERETEMEDTNAYYQLVMEKYQMMKEYLKNYPETKIPDLRKSLASEDVIHYNIVERSSRRQKQKQN